jgi:hypothetical protein
MLSAHEQKKIATQGRIKDFHHLSVLIGQLRPRRRKVHGNVKKKKGKRYPHSHPYRRCEETHRKSNASSTRRMCHAQMDPTGQSCTAGSSPCMCHVAIRCYRRRTSQEG